MLPPRAIRAIVVVAAMVTAALIASAQPTPPDDDDDDDDDDAGDGSDEPVADTPAPPEGLAVLDQTRAIPVGFNHLMHDRDLVVENRDSPPCASCHATRGKGELVGRPDHKACFGACHGASPVRKGGKIDAGDRAKVCAACHAPTALIRAAKGPGKLAVSYPPFAIEPDFGIQMSHAGHASAACTSCHPAAPKPKRGAIKRAPSTVHARCTGCHDNQAQPAMTACTGCHVEAFGTASGPSRIAPNISVAFEHAGHARRTPKAPCTACHAEIAKASTNDLPTPKAIECAASGCHDGAAAFSVTVACTKCHKERPRDWDVYRSDNRFSHDRHVERIPDAGCVSCHRLGRNGDAATTGHTACDSASCHATEFMQRKPEICGGCHVGTEPWRVLTEDQRPLPETEHGAVMPHDRHRQPCTTCHSLASGTRQLRPPRGHASCKGSGCHAADAGPTPRLAECEGCHRAGLVDARNQLRLAARWSVRARFRHALHASDPRTGTALACDTCHAGVAASKALADIPTPTKPACASCHDGAIAFKVTGTGCAKCHGKTPP